MYSPLLLTSFGSVLGSPTELVRQGTNRTPRYQLPVLITRAQQTPLYSEQTLRHCTLSTLSRQHNDKRRWIRHAFSGNVADIVFDNKVRV
jgi:hypothetical protein